MDREHYIVVRRKGLEWCVITEVGETCLRSRDEAIQAAMRFAAERSQGEPIRIQIASSEGVISPLAFETAARTH